MPSETRTRRLTLRRIVQDFLRAWDNEADDPAGVNLTIARMRAEVAPANPQEDETDAR